MTELQALIEKTELAFSSPELKLPEPPHEYKRKLEALEEAGLPQQRAALIWDLRCWQAEELGFKRVTQAEAVRLLMGEESNGQGVGEWQTLEWMYKHHTDEVLQGAESTWGEKANQFYRKERQGAWYLPPFGMKEKWRCQYGKFNFLKKDVPYGAVLKLIEAKKLKLFNAFGVMAPMECWLTASDLDPIILGEIWEMPPAHESNSGREAYFFLAQWK